jgi:hypothetical protein
MKVYEAPEPIPYIPHVFLAGGITGCPDWQADLIARIKLHRPLLVLLNPRRANFDVRDPTASEVQIRWEHEALRRADLISFWFSAATLNPITLYELGTWTQRKVPILVGIEPGYAREIDVREQTGLERPEVEIVDNLDALAAQILKETQ